MNETNTDGLWAITGVYLPESESNSVSQTNWADTVHRMCNVNKPSRVIEIEYED